MMFQQSSIHSWQEYISCYVAKSQLILRNMERWKRKEGVYLILLNSMAIELSPVLRKDGHKQPLQHRVILIAKKKKKICLGLVSGSVLPSTNTKDGIWIIKSGTWRLGKITSQVIGVDIMQPSLCLHHELTSNYYIFHRQLPHSWWRLDRA